MKSKFAALLTGLCTSGSLVAAAPGAPSRTTAPAAPAKPVDVLIHELSDEQYKVREQATQALWAVGRPALPALEATAAGDDPEQVFRAKELIRKIKMDITPETNPAVAELVERFGKASQNEKMGLFGQLRKHRAWRQILKLYATETSAEQQAKFQRQIADIALTAARESLLDGRPASAREFLEMAPATAQGLLALADFHRSQGTLDEELKRASTLQGPNGAAWQLALFRAAGNTEAARDVAEAAGEPMVFASLSALLGDPIPWLKTNETFVDGTLIPRVYSALAIKRWGGATLRPADLDPLVREMNGRGQHLNAVDSLFLLGETELGEDGLLKRSKSEAFIFYDKLEAVPEALKTIGLDPENPDYTAWVAKHFDSWTAGDEGDENEPSAHDLSELILLASFLEIRGLSREAEAAFLPPLQAMAEKEPRNFTDFLTTLFGGNASARGESGGAPELARTAAAAWAGEDANRWLDVVEAAFGSQEWTNALWSWLGELDPAATAKERFEGMCALLGMGRDPHHLRAKWLGLGWAAVAETQAEKRLPMLQMLGFIFAQQPDVANSLRAWDMLDDDARNEFQSDLHIVDLTAAGRWKDAARVSLDLVDRYVSAGITSNLRLRACAAACLRNAGQLAEAAAQDALVEKLALGNDAAEIGGGYAEGGDYRRAADWWERAAIQGDPTTPDFVMSLRQYGQALLDRGSWLEAAAVAEIRAQCDSTVQQMESPSIGRLGMRLQSDLGRALANLKNDRAGSIAMLARSLEIFPSDGSLADDFFPALRRAGLMKEHDEWFQKSWDRLSAVLARFPDADNTGNTAAWLASRAQRKLGEAERIEAKALDVRPEQAAYLDTMGEIQFALGKRGKALEWSAKAVNFMPNSAELRQQYERFRTAPLPR